MAEHINTRELYHAARAALTGKRNWDSGLYVFRIQGSYTDHERLVRAALRKRLQRDKLPPGMAEQVKLVTRVLHEREAEKKPRALHDRLLAYVARKYRAVIRERGGETQIEGNRLQVKQYDPRTGLVLLTCSGWRQYSRAFGNRYAELAYLCGRDDNGPWAARVPGKTYTISAALEALKPAAVWHAERQGRRVLRQGDVYVIERKRDGMSEDALPAGHHWDPATRMLSHDDGHHPLHVPFPAIPIQNKALLMGRQTGLIRSSPYRAYD